MNARAPLRAVAWLLGLNALALAGLAGWAAAGWPGEPNHILFIDRYYCEALRSGWVKQPANTWSCLAFVGVGLALAPRCTSRRGAVLAVLISLIGPGSMALHAGMTTFGGALDVLSMFLFIGFLSAHNASRLWPALQPRFNAVLALTGAAMVTLAALLHRVGHIGFGVLIGVFLLSEVALARGAAALSRDRRWLAAAAVLFFTAFGVWLLSESARGPLCVDPTSLLQGHAVWHVLCALAAGALFLHVERELAA